MRVDHRRSKVFMIQKRLYGSDVISVLQQMGRIGVTKRMTAGSPDDASLLNIEVSYVAETSPCATIIS